MAELETAIRDALRSRSDQVVLHSTTLRARRHRSFAPLLAAAIVLVLAVTTALVVTHRGGGRNQSGGATTFVGYQWRLVSVTDSVGRLQVPSALGAGAALQFSPDGEVVGSDTVNALSGRFRVTSGGYTVTDVATSLAAYAGNDRDRRRVIAAVGACFYTHVGDTDEPHASVRATLSADTLTLSVTGVVLTYERAGAQVELTPSSSTPPVSGPLGIVGYRWNLTRFSDRQGPGSVGRQAAWISFPSVTSIQGDDSANGFQATMRISGHRFAVSDASVGAVGGTGPNRVGAAVDAALTGMSVNVRLNGDILTLTTGRTSLTLVRAGAVAPDSSIPSATSSS